MATGLVCNVLHLSQHPPPVPVLLDGMALPRPLPTRYSLAQRLARHRHGAYRWRRPSPRHHHPSSSQAGKVWAADPQLEEDLRESLVVMGPGSVINTPHRLSRSLTAPPASLQSSSLEGEEEQDEERKEDTKTPQSAFSFKDLVPRNTEESVTVFPVRPPMSQATRPIPGRLFAKPTLTADQMDQLGYFQHVAKPSMACRPQPWFPPHKSDSRGDHTINLALCVTHRSHHYDPPLFTTCVNAQRHQDIVLRPRLFTIRSNRKADNAAKNRLTESLCADATTAKRFAKLPLTRLSRGSETNADDLGAVVLHGQRKHLHSKPILLEPGQSDCATECGDQAAVGDTSSKPQAAKEEPHKMSNIETDGSDVNGIAGNLHAPLNSPTDQKAPSLPELT
ncbi:hypothetical protein ACOMHN_026812 [Nucella lapillus]